MTIKTICDRGGFITTMCTLRGGRKRIVHVIAKALAETLNTGVQHPLVGIRDFHRREDLITVRHAEILGPSELFHTPDEPLPGTNGRGICYVVTEAPIRLHFDLIEAVQAPVVPQGMSVDRRLLLRRTA